MEATKKLIQDGRWIPIEEVDATSSRVIISTSIQATTDSRLADALEVAVEALNVYAVDENYYNGTAREALAKIEQIANGCDSEA